jgi:hypothetical protein
MEWSKQEQKKLHNLVVKQGKSVEQAARIVKRSIAACSSKLRRLSPATINKAHKRRQWTLMELQKLYDLRNKEDLEFPEIGERLNRSSISCERQYQSTNWEILLGSTPVAATREMSEQIAAEEQAEKDKNLVETYVEWLLGLSRGDYDRLQLITKQAFVEKATRAFESSQIDFKATDLPIAFDELKKMAVQRLESFGLAYQKEQKLGKGTYVVVGDSHGKHTKNGMFRLMLQVNRHLKPAKIIHVGHIFDDDGDISYHWGEYSNLVVLGTRDELRNLKELEDVTKYNVVKDRIQLGHLSICNQYDITDYVTKFIGSIRPHIFPYSTIVNCHRHEMFTRCTHKGHRLIASPGCLSEKHIVKTIKQLIFRDGSPSVKLTFPHGYHKYNRAEHYMEYWEQGMLVVEIDDEGDFTIHPCRILKTSKGYTTSFLGDIITESGVEKPDEKIFFNGDMHCDLHDPKVLDIQEQFCQVYKPDAHVNVGDVINNYSLNHHEMDMTGGYMKKDTLEEVANTKFVIERMRRWAKRSYLIYGNHERFMRDFCMRYPQLANMMSMSFLFGLESLDISLTPLKNVLKLGPVQFVHGDIEMRGQIGANKLEKLSATFGENTVMGNIHYPSIRNGCYSVGFSGLMDQGYNEPEASQWMPGMGYCNIYQDKCFISLVNINDDKCIAGGKVYRPGDVSSWTPKSFKSHIHFDFDKGTPAR